MLIKRFKIGSRWEHTDRIRETMLGEGMATCPVTLLFKDHKNWKSGTTTIPPTKHVAGGHLGMNLHLSEVVSDILEPLVGTLEEGEEVISTEDLLAKIDKLNILMEGWTSGTWWENKTHGNYIACGKCLGTPLDTREKAQVLPELCNCGREESLDEGVLRVTINYLKYCRRLDWEERVGWNPSDKDRLIDSSEALPEDLQDFTCPNLIVGADVVSLYPSMDVAKVSKMMREAIMNSPVKWEGVDYAECARYIALNWSEEKCRSSTLRRVLPVRRGENWHQTRY